MTKGCLNRMSKNQCVRLSTPSNIGAEIDYTWPVEARPAGEPDSPGQRRPPGAFPAVGYKDIRDGDSIAARAARRAGQRGSAPKVRELARVQCASSPRLNRVVKVAPDAGIDDDYFAAGIAPATRAFMHGANARLAGLGMNRDALNNYRLAPVGS
jgi:hypothetical protein